MAPLSEVKRSAAVLSSDGCHPATVPSSVTKIKRSPKKASRDALKTCPVGADGGSAPRGGGMVTLSSKLPASSYTCDSPLPFEETQAAPLGLKARPQALTRFLS